MPLIDAEVIVMLFDFLGRLGFTGLSVLLNSVGTEATRPAYVEAVRSFFSSNEETLGEDDRRRLAENPLRVLDSKDPAVRKLVSSPSFPKMVDLLARLDPVSDQHYREVMLLLGKSGVPFKEDPLLVRGLDYYSRTVFEVTAEGLGAQNALVGGGRYDKLVSDLNGPKTPGFGFAIGEDRLVNALPEAFRREAHEGTRPVAVVPVGSPDVHEAFAVAGELRRAGVAADLFSGRRGLGAALKAVERTGISLAVLVGQNETSRGAVVVKNLATHSQEELAREGIAAALRARL